MNVSKINIPGQSLDISDDVAREKLSNIVFVNDYGAKGDGITDDTSAIQQAVNDVHCGEIRFYPGNYKITSPINLPERGIVFNGSGARVFAGDNFTGEYMIGFFPTQGVIANSRGIQTIMKNFELDGNQNAAQCIRLFRWQGTITDMSIHDFTSIGIYEDLGEQAQYGGKMFNNIIIFGASHPTEKWTEADGKIGMWLHGDDCMNNINIGRCQIGIYLNSSYNRLNNVHIWQQYNPNFTNTATQNTTELFQKTRGIKLGSHATVSATNLYIDRCYIAFDSDSANTTGTMQTIVCNPLNIVCQDDVIGTAGYVKCALFNTHGSYDVTMASYSIGGKICYVEKFSFSPKEYFPTQRLVMTQIRNKPSFALEDIADHYNDGDVIQFINIPSKVGNYRIGRLYSNYYTNGGIRLTVTADNNMMCKFDADLTFSSAGANAEPINFVRNLSINNANGDYGIAFRWAGEFVYGDNTYQAIDIYMIATNNPPRHFALKYELLYGNISAFFTQQVFTGSVPSQYVISCGTGVRYQPTLPSGLVYELSNNYVYYGEVTQINLNIRNNTNNMISGDLVFPWFKDVAPALITKSDHAVNVYSGAISNNKVTYNIDFVANAATNIHAAC